MRSIKVLNKNLVSVKIYLISCVMSWSRWPSYRKKVGFWAWLQGSIHEVFRSLLKEKKISILIRPSFLCHRSNIIWVYLRKASKMLLIHKSFKGSALEKLPYQKEPYHLPLVFHLLSTVLLFYLSVPVSASLIYLQVLEDPSAGILQYQT